MKIIKILVLLTIFGAMSQSCNTVERFWVRGIKTPCDAGAGKMECLNIYYGNALDEANWQTFYAPIEGFEFKPGVLQKIEVEREKVQSSKVPADGSSYQYSLKKVLETRVDNTSQINGSWLVVTINGNPINRKMRVPQVNFNVEENIVSGFDGCNNFSGKIEKLTSIYIQKGLIKSTQKMCIDMTTANEFNKAFSTVSGYNIQNETLSLYNENKEIVMTLIPYQEDTSKVDDRINNSWTAVKIFGNPINRKDVVPTISVNTSNNMFIGNNGCNNFTAKIEKATSDQLILSTVSTTKKACMNMETADKFDLALLKTNTYEVSDKELILYDTGGVEVLRFIPQLPKNQ